MNKPSDRAIRYIHAADLHLDRPFAGLPASDPEKLAAMQKAPYQALRRLGNLCETERPDFLVIAGDVYDQEERSIKAQLALRDLCVRLAGLNIPVFIVHGNHDPLSSRLTSISWPDNVTIFPGQVYAVPVCKNGEIIAFVHGVSHERNPEKENLALKFRRLSEFDGFQLGLLHCAITGSKDADSYAPCSVEDLSASRLDAWALGHVHSGQILSEKPFISYSGASQGSHVNEAGPKGCLSVQARPKNGAWEAAPQFRPLAPLLWENLTIDASNLETLDEIESKSRQTLDNLLAEAAPGVTSVICRIRLEGRTPLHNILRLPSTLKDLGERLASYEKEHPALYVKDLLADTRPEISKNISEQQDLLGEIWRLADKLESSPEALAVFAEKALAPLYNSTNGKLLQRPDEHALQELLNEARLLCQETLENN